MMGKTEERKMKQLIFVFSNPFPLQSDEVASDSHWYKCMQERSFWDSFQLITSTIK